MKKNTRFAFNAYLTQLAKLNGVPVEELSSKFNVEPSVAQTLEDTIQQSAAFLTQINVVGVSEQNAALNAESVRPVADRVTTQAATIHDYSVKAKLHLFDGVAAGPCLEAANERLAAYLTEQKKLGRSVRRESYGAVLRVAGVDWVEMIEPAEDIIMDRTQAGNCTGTDVSVAADGVAS